MGIAEMPIHEFSIEALPVLSDKAGGVPESYLSVAAILLYQILSFYKSVSSDLSRIPPPPAEPSQESSKG